MKKRIFFSSFLLCTVVSLTVRAQDNPSIPKLVVGIMIDQLRSDYIENFWSDFGEDGFKRLLKEGTVYPHASYDFDRLDKASAVAAVYTGSTPYVNGIIGERWMDRETGRLVSCVEDARYKGWYTNDCTSPARLRVTTLTDELEVVTAGRAYICAIAPDRETAVLSAGHAADAAVWKNDLTGVWCGSSYYGESPSWVNSFNKAQERPATSLFKLWEPLLPVDAYDKVLYGTPVQPFSHAFDASSSNGFWNYKTSACMNTEIGLIARHCLVQSPLGGDDIPDFLSLFFYAGNYKHLSPAEAPLELHDIYVRLDRELTELLKAIDKKVGAERTLLFVTSTGYSDRKTTGNTAYRLPGGEIKLDRTTALLNVYLCALFGRGEYVSAYHDTEIYLNHKLIDDKQLNLQDVIARSADFLLRVDGVEDVFSVNELNGVNTAEMQRVRNGFNRSCSGDLSLQLLPGWCAIGEDENGNCILHDAILRFPVIFWGAGWQPSVIKEALSTGCIAPTVAWMLRMDRPNGSRQNAIEINN